MLKNERGSIMAVSFVIIALISFSLTSITAYTFRTAENTNRIVENNESDNEAKRLIEESMTAYDTLFLETMSNNSTATNPYAWFEDLEDPDNYEDEPLMTTIEGEYGVSISVAYDKFTTSQEAGSSRVYRFAYPISDSREMVKYLYFSNYGVEYEEYDAFLYSIGTSGTLAMNGGQYENAAEIYAKNLYAGYSTAYKSIDQDGNYTYQVFEAGDYNLPSGDDAKFTSPDYRVCGIDTVCLSKDTTSGKVVVKKDNYSEVTLPESDYYSNLFMGFDYNGFYNDSMNKFIENNNSLTPDSLQMRADIDPAEPQYYENVLNGLITDGTIQSLDSNTLSTDFTLTDDYVAFSNLTLNSAGTLDLNGNTLIVTGDLYIDNIEEIIGDSQLFVHGDIHVRNATDLLVLNNLYTMSKIIVDFNDDGIGFAADNATQNQAMALYAKGNILFERNESVPSNNSGSKPALLLLSDSSIKIDSAIQLMAFGGAIYAMGDGEGLEDVVIEDIDGNQDPFRGILINSYNGTLDRSGNASPGETGDEKEKTNNGGGGGGANTGSGKPGWGGAPGNSGSGREDSFAFSSLADATQGNNEDDLRATFGDLPTFERLVIVPNEGDLTVERSTFTYETTIQ